MTSPLTVRHLNLWKSGHLQVKYGICTSVSGADGSHFVGFQWLLHTSGGKEDFGCVPDGELGPVCLGLVLARWKALCLLLAWFSPEAQVWAAVCVGRGWEVPDDANHLTAFLIRLLLCRTFSPFRLVPRVYVCCEREATKNVGFWMRKTEGCICLCPFLAQGLASHPGSLGLSFPLCQMRVLIPALNVYVYVD